MLDHITISSSELWKTLSPLSIFSSYVLACISCGHADLTWSRPNRSVNSHISWVYSWVMTYSRQNQLHESIKQNLHFVSDLPFFLRLKLILFLVLQQFGQKEKTPFAMLKFIILFMSYMPWTPGSTRFSLLRSFTRKRSHGGLRKVWVQKQTFGMAAHLFTPWGSNQSPHYKF